MLLLSELMTSWMRTSQVTLLVHSLTLPRIAEWLCSSTMPGATSRPVASMTTAPAGAASPLPTAAILPARTKRSACSSVPRGPAVHSVAFLTSTAVGWAGGDMRHASVLPITTGVTTGSSFLGAAPWAPSPPAISPRGPPNAPLNAPPGRRPPIPRPAPPSGSGCFTPTTLCAPTPKTDNVPRSTSCAARRSKSSAGSVPRRTVNRTRAPS